MEPNVTWTGNVKVQDALKANRTALLGDKQTVTIFAGGGAMAGAFGAGVLAGLEYAGFGNACRTYVGVSAGAVNLAFFASSRASALADLYAEDLASPRFCNPARFWNIIDMEYARNALHRRLDMAQLKRSQAPIYAGLTRSDGEGVFMDLRSAENGFAVLAASTAIPLNAQSAQRLPDGASYFDGEMALPLPVHDIGICIAAANMLLVLNRPFSYLSETDPCADAGTVMRLLCPKMFKDHLLRRNRIYNTCVNFVRQRLLDGARIGIIAPDAPMDEMCRDPRVLRRIVYAASEQTEALFKS